MFRLEKDVSRQLGHVLRNYGGWYRRIEDASGNLGTYDGFCALKGWPAWVECKLAGPRAKPALRPGQMAFAHDAWAAGVPAWILIGHPDGSCRLIDGRTDGDDWREHLVLRCSRLDAELIRAIFAST